MSLTLTTNVSVDFCFQRSSMFIFTQYAEITDDEKQAHIGT